MATSTSRRTRCGICHDRFIIVDGEEVVWTGASLKDAGRLTFAAAKMGAEIIPGLFESIRKATTESCEYPTRSRRSHATECLSAPHVPMVVGKNGHKMA